MRGGGGMECQEGQSLFWSLRMSVTVCGKIRAAIKMRFLGNVREEGRRLVEVAPAKATGPKRKDERGSRCPSS